jgi:HEAT repeat protein
MKNKLAFVLLVLIGIKTFAAVEGFGDFIKMAGNDKIDMNTRWSALMRAAAVAEGSEIDKIREFTSSKEWYLRNAALVALNKVDPELAQAEAVKLLTDKALVVRSAAVEIVSHNLSDKNKYILIGEMDKGYNFNRASSLWIRKQILEKIALTATEKDQQLFVKNLFDSDKKISELSANTLERITGKKMDRKKFVQNWREYAKHENWN